jgi:two-component system cell cycle sensor histidine kinase/response regulator CckA
VQISDVSIVPLLVGGTLALLILAAAYIYVTLRSHHKIVDVQKARLEAVARSEKHYKGLFDNSLAGIMTFDVDNWTIFKSNRAIWTMFGCESQDELQKCVMALPSAQLRKMQNLLLHNLIVDNEEIQTNRKNEDELWVLFSAQMTAEDGLAQAVVVDITERKQSEEKIKEQNALLDQTLDAILVIDCQGQVKYWNSGAELMYGWKCEEVVGGPLVDKLYDDSNRNHFQSSMEDIKQFNEWSGEQYHKRKDGKEILVESRWKIVEGRNNGRRLIMIVNSDITEKRRLEQQSFRAQKMESIAVLTGGLAHDLHNILAPLNMSIHVLRKRLKGRSSLAVLTAIDDPIQNGIELVKNILTYGKGIAGERLRVGLHDVLRPVLDKMVRESSQTIRIVENLGNEQQAILGDRTQLKQVFLNLCLNARDAMTEGGTLTVEAASLDSNESLLEHFPSAEEGPFIEVRVSDTGKGIRKDDLERIFEPFFTTKEGTGGTGLGLSVVQGIVTSHKGFVTVESVLGKGTTFRVFLPAIINRTN